MTKLGAESDSTSQKAFRASMPSSSVLATASVRAGFPVASESTISSGSATSAAATANSGCSRRPRAASSVNRTTGPAAGRAQVLAAATAKGMQAWAARM
ncbi:MAG: hypothetical protein AW07_02741 [Candidatus Accumulibacter sp. SK-11]|nr:MAG: hypothetical protein AW07_02741 [Candidatus Accumulibacter sp. SK-11]